MSIKILNPGALTTIQDLGRTGCQEYGFQVSGCLDQDACRMANLLVGNDPGEAVLEMTLLGAMIFFEEDAVIALTGGDFSPVLNGQPCPRYEAVAVKKGSILGNGFASKGCRGYIAFAGGLDVPEVLGSRSTNLKCKIGGFSGRALKANDVIKLRASKGELPDMELRKWQPPQFLDEITLRVVPGLQESYFTEEGLADFYSETYTVSNENDRMGCKLQGKPVGYKDSVDIISDGIPLGGIQIPSGGQPIIMLADRQTTGGYAKIGAVASVDIPRLVQLKTGGKIRFEKITVEKAQKLYRKRERQFQKLQKKWRI